MSSHTRCAVYTVNCNIFLCDDNDCGDVPLSTFTFAADLASFPSTPAIVSQDDDQTTTLMLTGTQTNAQLNLTSPDCGCE